MKLPLISLSLILLATACSETTSPAIGPVVPVQSNVEPQYETSPLPVWSERQQQLDDEAHYNASIDRIAQLFVSENTQLNRCASEAPKQTCRDMRREFCQTDTAVDSRGTSHRKPYCRKDSSHN